MTLILHLRSRPMRFILSILVILSIFAVLFQQLYSEWDNIASVQWKQNPIFFVLHFVFLIMMFSGLVMGWKNTYKLNGQEVTFCDASYTWLVSNLGKYIPGKIFMFAGRIGLSKIIGIRETICISALTIEHLFMLVATLPFLIALPFGVVQIDLKWLVGAMITISCVGLSFLIAPKFFFQNLNKILVRIGKQQISANPTRALVVSLLSIYLVIWIFYGLSGAMLIYALELGNDLSLLRIFSSFVAAWVIGFLSFLTPGGLGVREGVLVLMLRPELETSQAILVAIIARISWTIIEMAGVVVGFYMKRNIKTAG